MIVWFFFLVTLLLSRANRFKDVVTFSLSGVLALFFGPQALKKKDLDAKKKKDFGKGGARGFESRSMQSFVAALEKGEAKHLMHAHAAQCFCGRRVVRPPRDPA